MPRCMLYTGRPRSIDGHFLCGWVLIGGHRAEAPALDNSVHSRVHESTDISSSRHHRLHTTNRSRRKADTSSYNSLPRRLGAHLVTSEIVEPDQLTDPLISHST